MSTLGHDRIEAELCDRSARNRLFVTPLLSPKQIGGASIDVRLGFDFVTIRRGNVGAMDPAAPSDVPGRFKTHHLLNLGDKFHLHPNEMALASTLEYVRLPLNLSAYVTSRSKWGRLGLIIATATVIHSGFSGTITLELVNHGNVPLVLYPGLVIAQLIILETIGATPYEGSLARQIGPLALDATLDRPPDLPFWLNQPGS